MRSTPAVWKPVQQNGRFTLFSGKFLSNIYSIPYDCNTSIIDAPMGSRSAFEFPSRVPVCTVPSSMDRTSCCWCNKVDAVRLYASYRLYLLLPKGQICVLRVKVV